MRDNPWRTYNQRTYRERKSKVSQKEEREIKDRENHRERIITQSINEQQYNHDTNQIRGDTRIKKAIDKLHGRKIIKRKLKVQIIIFIIYFEFFLLFIFGEKYYWR